MTKDRSDRPHTPLGGRRGHSPRRQWSVSGKKAGKKSWTQSRLDSNVQPGGIGYRRRTKRLSHVYFIFLLLPSTLKRDEYFKLERLPIGKIPKRPTRRQLRQAMYFAAKAKTPRVEKSRADLSWRYREKEGAIPQEWYDDRTHYRLTGKFPT